MALYVGANKYNVIIGDIICDMRLYSEIPITNGIRLLSSDDYTLKDINGLYLTIEKEGE